MGLLAGKNVLLGISGSIAAYKAAFLVRELIKSGAQVQVVLTPMAREFVTALTLGTLSKRPVLEKLVKDESCGVWNNHVELGLWADLMIIAPATAHTLSGMATGNADSLLLTTYLSAKCPVYFAPAMDLDMHRHPSTTENIALLTSHGNHHIPAESGELASGLEGKGRMAEPEHIIHFIEGQLLSEAPLSGKKIMITAGPTFEAIDPVRFIGNRSSGKMGFAIAQAAQELGAEVTLISGPVNLLKPRGAKVIMVESAQEMYDACLEKVKEVDIAIFTAAVADYRPDAIAPEKIKKTDQALAINLVKTVDILQTLGRQKRDGQLFIGFALETQNEMANAKKKLSEKNCDLIVLNSLRDPGAGFGHDTNKVTLITDNKSIELELMPKADLAHKIMAFIQETFL